MAVVEVLDGSLFSESSIPEPGLEAALGAHGDLAIDQQPQAFLEVQCLDIVQAVLFLQCVFHAGEFQLTEFFQGGMIQPRYRSPCQW